MTEDNIEFIINSKTGGTFPASGGENIHGWEIFLQPLEQPSPSLPHTCKRM